LVAKVLEEARQLHRREHALVGHGPAGQRREVHLRFLWGCLGALAQRVHPAVEVDARRPVTVVFRCGDEQLGHVRHAAECGHPDLGPVGVDGYLTPAEHLEALLGGDALDARTGHVACNGIAWKETDSGCERVLAVGRGLRQVEVDDLAQQVDGKLQQNASAVTAIGFGARCPAVFEVLQRRQSVGNDGVRTAALDVGDHGDAARV
jgi:hypothetical protein